jgi:hypothetical protein
LFSKIAENCEARKRIVFENFDFLLDGYKKTRFWKTILFCLAFLIASQSPMNCAFPTYARFPRRFRVLRAVSRPDLQSMHYFFASCFASLFPAPYTLFSKTMIFRLWFLRIPLFRAAHDRF